MLQVNNNNNCFVLHTSFKPFFFCYISLGQCLNTLTDDNKDLLIEFQNNSHYIESLLNIVKNPNQNILVQVLSCGKEFLL